MSGVVTGDADRDVGGEWVTAPGPPEVAEDPTDPAGLSGRSDALNELAAAETLGMRDDGRAAPSEGFLYAVAALGRIPAVLGSILGMRLPIRPPLA